MNRLNGIALSALLLVGCGDVMERLSNPELKPGSAKLVEKEYKADYTTPGRWEDETYGCYTYGYRWQTGKYEYHYDYSGCTRQVYREPVYHPAEYRLVWEQCDRTGERHADKRGCVQVKERVDAIEYHKANVGERKRIEGEAPESEG